MTEFKNPATAVDVVAFTVIDGRLNVALTERVDEPCVGQSALPGVFLGQNEPVSDAIARAGDKSHLDISGKNIPMRYRDSLERDERFRVVSLPHIVFNPIATDDTEWVPVADVLTLPFDHSDILNECVDVVTTIEGVSDLFYAGPAAPGDMTAPAVSKILLDVSRGENAILRTMKRVYSETDRKVRPTGGGRPASVFV